MASGAVTKWLVHYQQRSQLSHNTNLSFICSDLKMLQGEVLIIDTQAIDKLPLKKILFQGLYSTGFSIHRIFGIFLVLGHNWAHALARCSRLLRTASPRLYFVQHKDA